MFILFYSTAFTGLTILSSAATQMNEIFRILNPEYVTNEFIK